ncbi:MAG: hypothetical protein ACFFDS_09545 [Candidatus Thorarchaeota archaeon]
MVDWRLFIEKQDYRQGTRSQEEYDKMVDELLKSNILSLEPEGNYCLIGCSIVVSPRHSRLWRPILYFTRRSDAKDYAKLKFSKAQYGVDIHKVEETVKE